MEKSLKLVCIERKHNSVYGNPTWYCLFVDSNGNYLRGKTASNAMIGYELGYSSEGKTFNIEYHYTKSGNTVFDRIND